MLIRFIFSDSNINLDIPDGSTISDIKSLIKSKYPQYNDFDLKFVCLGDVLDDDKKTLSEYMINTNATIHVVTHNKKTNTVNPVDNTDNDTNNDDSVDLDDLNDLINNAKFIQLLKTKKFYNLVKLYMENPDLLFNDTKNNILMDEVPDLVKDFESTLDNNLESYIKAIKNMGFDKSDDVIANVLKQTNNNIDSAIELLLMADI